MEITLAPERIFQIQPRFTLDQARAKAEEKKVGLVAGMLTNLFARPKPEDILLEGFQLRWVPFWHLTVHTRTVYDRQRQFQVAAAGPEVKRVTLLGETLPVEVQAKGGPVATITGVEHCEEDQRTTRLLTGDGKPFPDGARLADLPRQEVADLAVLQGEGMHLEAPELSAAAVVRQVIAEVVKPVRAQAIHEERVEIEAIDLCVRPVYAFEYAWAAKGKRAVIEVDGLSGDVGVGGPSMKEHLRKMLNRDVLFDISADAVGTFVPGGGIVIKLTKAAIDMKK